MNILFTCAGRRYYLIDYFQKNKPRGAKIVAVDMQNTAPALGIADKAYIVPAADDEKYMEKIKEICKKEDIKAVISLNDIDLPKIAIQKEEFNKIGVLLLVPNEKAIDICYDKWKTIGFAETLGLRCPKTYLTYYEAVNSLSADELGFPVVIKPRWGSASIGIEITDNIEELHHAYRYLRKKLLRTAPFCVKNANKDQGILFQEMLRGKEFGMDVFNDFNGKVVAVYVKEKLAMRSGETDKAVLRNHPELQDMGHKIGSGLKHIGNLDCDIFDCDGQLYLLEMNPRFGGGYPFSHMAGANFPAAIYSWLQGKEADPSCFQYHYDRIFAKCDILVDVTN